MPPKQYAERFKDFVLIDVFKPRLKDNNFNNRLDELLEERRLKEVKKKEEEEKKRRKNRLGVLGRELAELSDSDGEIELVKIKALKESLNNE